MSQNIDQVKSCDNFHYLNDTHKENLCFTEFSSNIHWNTRLAASEVFNMFTQSFFFNSIIVHMSEKYGTHSVPKSKQNNFLIYKKVVFKIISTLINK